VRGPNIKSGPPNGCCQDISIALVHCSAGSASNRLVRRVYVGHDLCAMLLLAVVAYTSSLSADERESYFGGAAIKAILCSGMLLALFCMPMLALSNVTAWAKTYRVDVYRVAVDPCPGRCNGNRLTICSACLGVRTCAQHHFCTNNPAITCSGESTVSVPCWNPW
jgi:hypothetical protein